MRGRGGEESWRRGVEEEVKWRRSGGEVGRKGGGEEGRRRGREEERKRCGKEERWRGGEEEERRRGEVETLTLRRGEDEETLRRG